ncbi:helix-turn-helix transcriptional regulator [Devosia salina]|uniref:Helix-turn-helix transcriptional regulator n=1 Tax=Devosia salina TaxID=2860336 RepID=A0ABX8WB36_9HYPH|nr:helix-turn-helix transcriptional regulator [Devosia salina]QYO75166.1 helix-turn-helix transcriptional regulator [Devosia salina]
MSVDDFDRLEDLAYEAALVPELWPTALSRLAEYGEARGGVLFSVDDVAARWTASESVHSIMQEFVDGGWAARNTRMSNGMRKGLHLQPRFLTERDYYDDDGDLMDDVLHREFFFPRGVGYSCGTLAQLPQGDLLCLSFERDRSAGHADYEVVERLNALRPHLVRSATIASRLGFERVRTAVDTLNHMGYAAAAISGAGRMLLCNQALDHVNELWTTAGGERFVLFDKTAHEQLYATLGHISGSAGVRSIPLRGATGTVRHVLHVVPVRRSAQDIFSGSAAILVFTAAVTKEGNPALLQVLFDLTPAEAEVAYRLSNGNKIDRIATISGKSRNTVRNQVAAIMDKTGCGRQAELVALLARLGAAMF